MKVKKKTGNLEEINQLLDEIDHSMLITGEKSIDMSSILGRATPVHSLEFAPDMPLLNTNEIDRMFLELRNNSPRIENTKMT